MSSTNWQATEEESKRRHDIDKKKVEAQQSMMGKKKSNGRKELNIGGDTGPEMDTQKTSISRQRG